MARPKDKEEIILKAAFEAYTEKGFKAASMQDIATRAGLGKGTLYEYFRTKDELFIQGIRYKAESGLKRIHEFVDSETTAEKKLEAMITFTQAFIGETDFLFKLVTAGDLLGLKQESTSQLYEMIVKTRESHVAIYHEILELGQREGLIRDLDLDFAADTTAELVVSYMHIEMLKEFMGGIPRKDPPEVLRKKMLDMILNGVGLHGMDRTVNMDGEDRR